MRAKVFSTDQHVLTVCREVAQGFPSVAWELNFSLTIERSSGAGCDLLIWDYLPGAIPPDPRSWAQDVLLLVSSQDLESFRINFPEAQPGLLLKPITAAGLRKIVGRISQANADEAARQSVRSDREELLQGLMEANLRLQQFEIERSNFLSRALHDFHAPVTAFSGYCGLLLDDKFGSLNEEQRTVVQRMLHSVQRLSRMSQAMYQLSIGRQVQQKVKLAPGEMRECLEQALYEVYHLIEEKGLDVQIDLEPQTEELLLDESQIEQLFMNLFENACKFSSRYGSVVVRGYPYFWDRRVANVSSGSISDRRRSVNHETPNAYRVDMQDSGPGIAPGQLQSIFEEYVSYAGGLDRSRGGLGLAICRMIISQHDGRIWAENAAQGARFSFVLPVVHKGLDVAGEKVAIDLRSVPIPLIKASIQ